jgi:hypothetical protein
VAQQTLDFVIAQQVTGQADVARLIKSVGALDAEMKRLRDATQGLGAGFDSAAPKIKGLTNPLDAQSKALRNTRQGMQMAGMQVNDFATSVSTGTSPVQAFNQQIGQLGYSLSMMQGTVGAVGRFLAGPWSILVIGAAMALGPMIENLLGVDDASKKTKLSLEDLESITQARRDSEIEIRLALAKTAAEYRSIQVEVQNTILQKHNLIRVTHEEIRQNFALAKAERDRIRQTIAGAGNLRAQAEMGTGLAPQLFLAEQELASQQQALMGSTASLEKSTTSLNAARLRVIQTDNKAANATSASTARVRESLSPMQSFLESLAKTDDRLELARQAYDAGKISLSQYRQEFEKAEKAQRSFGGTAENQIKVLKDGSKAFELPDMVKEIETPPALQAILDKNVEIKNSFDAIGLSVANAFKGMITGAQSFGDAFKGIIQAVIDELFRLFVVQQIVGMVSGALTSAFGGASPSGSGSTLGTGASLGFGRAAVGGYPAPGKPVMVGERGPELFVPTSSGKIIPNHQMGAGGGMTINVDARGATSPEMVRQQVQQGILEAAPSIVAAAEQRTISTLRRPRLAGVM